MSPGYLLLLIRRNWRSWIRKTYLFNNRKAILNSIKDKPIHTGLIISLTTIESRTASIEASILSIFNGQVLPELICVFVSSDTAKSLSRRNIIQDMLTKEILRIEIVEDVRSFTKLVYAIPTFPNKDIVICDDDVMFPDYWLRELIETSRDINDPKAVICHRAHEISFDANGKIEPYYKWIKEVKKQDRDSLLFPTGTGGILYPTGCLPSITTDTKAFLKLAPKADDIWFWLSAVSGGCTFHLTKRKFQTNQFLDVPDSQAINLWSTNVSGNSNDGQMKDSLIHFTDLGLLSSESHYGKILIEARKRYQ